MRFALHLDIRLIERRLALLKFLQLRLVGGIQVDWKPQLLLAGDSL
jgi:hypothetical protein